MEIQCVSGSKIRRKFSNFVVDFKMRNKIPSNTCKETNRPFMGEKSQHKGWAKIQQLFFRNNVHRKEQRFDVICTLELLISGRKFNLKCIAFCIKIHKKKKKWNS